MRAAVLMQWVPPVARLQRHPARATSYRFEAPRPRLARLRVERSGGGPGLVPGWLLLGGYRLGMRAGLAYLFLGLVACGADVRVQDDDGAGGNGGDAAGVNPTSSVDSAASTSGSGAASPTGGAGAGSAVTTSSGSGAGVQAPDCFNPSAEIGPYPDQPVATGQGLCDEAQIQGFIVECLSLDATETSCGAFTGENEACSTCLGYFGETPAFQPVLIGTAAGDFITLNFIACEAAAQGKLDCVGPVGDAQMCFWSYCTDCFFKASADELDACTAYTQGALCGDVPPSCNSLLYDSSPSCGGNDLDEAFTSIAHSLCGAP
jgi:hypothetical protein